MMLFAMATGVVVLLLNLSISGTQGGLRVANPFAFTGLYSTVI